MGLGLYLPCSETARDLPLVSIGLPVLNGAQYLPELINNLLIVDYPSVQIVIVDDASADRSEEICRSYADTYPRLKYVRNERHLGLLESMAKLVVQADGDLFLWGSGADRWSKSFLIKAVETMKNDPAVVLAVARSCKRGADGTVTSLHEPVLDTNCLSPVGRLSIALWAYQSGAELYGLYRRWALADALPLKEGVSTGLSFLAELACLGPFAEVRNEMIYLTEDQCQSDFLYTFRSFHLNFRDRAGHVESLRAIWELISLAWHRRLYTHQGVPLCLSLLSSVVTRFGLSK